MINRFVLLMALLLSGINCGFGEIDVPVLEERFYVVHLSSQNQLDGALQVTLTFSDDVDVTTLQAKNLAIVPKQDEVTANDDWKDLSKAISEGEMTSATSFGVMQDAKHLQNVTITCDETLPNGVYNILVLPQVQSQTGYFLDQRWVTPDRRHFVGEFVVENETVVVSAGDETTNESDDSNDENLSISEDGETDDFVSEVSNGPPFDWQRVVLTEIVTDPQQDHGESSGGNGVPFDDIPGSGTIGATDEFIEIYNGTDETIDLTNWSILMIDGTDETQVLDASTSDLFFSQGGSVEQLQAGELVVIGNPDGSMNNSITVELFDGSGNTVDQVSIEDANANDETDESYQRDEDGFWQMGAASPGLL